MKFCPKIQSALFVVQKKCLGPLIVPYILCGLFVDTCDVAGLYETDYLFLNFQSSKLCPFQYKIQSV